MRVAPRDQAFNDVVRAEIEDANPNERVLFIDSDNRIRQAIYPSEYRVLQDIRRHLEAEGVLKAVVHISARTIGDHSPRTSVVEYLPGNRVYTTTYRPALMFWDRDTKQDVVESYQQLFREEGTPDTS